MQNRRSQTAFQETDINTDVSTWALPEGAITRGHTNACGSVKFSPDGVLLASASYDGTILLWNMKPYLSPIDTH